MRNDGKEEKAGNPKSILHNKPPHITHHLADQAAGYTMIERRERGIGRKTFHIETDSEYEPDEAIVRKKVIKQGEHYQQQ